jgi:hypothetical protein
MPALVMPQQPKIHTNSSAISFAAQVMKFPSDGAREGFELLLVRHVTHLVRDSSQAWPDSDRAIIFASLARMTGWLVGGSSVFQRRANGSTNSGIPPPRCNTSGWRQGTSPTACG